jgi:hypothetical protein
MKRLILALFLVTPLFSYWKADFNIVKGEKIKKGSKTFYVISPGKSATMVLDKDQAVRLTVTNPGDPNILYILNGGKRYKEFPIKTHETIQLLLKKGDYELNNAKDYFYFRMYTWRPQVLTPVPPVGDGNVMTLQINDKKSAYYDAAKDKNLMFKITGPATFYIYARPDFSKASKTDIAAEFILRGQEGKKDIFNKKFMAKPSRVGSYIEQKEIVPGSCQKIRLKLTPGLHEIGIFFEKGKGRVRGYVEEKGKKKPQVAAGGLRLGGNGGMGYDSNPFRFSQQNIDLYKSGLKTDRFPDVVSLQDVFFYSKPMFPVDIKIFN